MFQEMYENLETNKPMVSELKKIALYSGTDIYTTTSYSLEIAAISSSAIAIF